MIDLRQAAQQALEVLETLQGGCTDSDDGTVEALTVWCPEVITALRTALEQPEQEPHAYCYVQRGSSVDVLTFDGQPQDAIAGTIYPLYAAPPAAEPAAQPEQEPVAFYRPHKGFYWAKPTRISAPIVVDVPPLPLYTTPPAAQRPWQGLDEDDIKEIVGPYGDTPIEGYTRKLFDQIESALRSKNT